MVTAVAFAAAYGLVWVAATRAGRPGGVSAEYAVIMNDLYSALLANVLSVVMATFIGATGFEPLRTQVLPDWLGAVSVGFAAGLLTPLRWVFEELSTI